MERHYYLRGKKRLVEELDDVVVVKPSVSSRESFKILEKELDKGARSTFKKLKSIFPKATEELNALSKAGWVFASPSRSTREAFTAREFDNDYETFGQVFKDRSGRVLIGTKRLNVKFLPSLSANEIQHKLEGMGLDITGTLRFAPNLFEVEVKAGEDTIDVSNKLHADDAVIYAEPQMISHLPQRLRPSDPLYHRQWQLSNNGSGGVAGADIDAEKAWTISKGRGARLAIIDNGFDVTHPDIRSAIYTSAGYFNSRGIFQNSLSGFPDSNHGTFCAGMSVARANNLGVVGSAPQAEFIPVACLSDQVGTQNTLARAIAYAADPSLESPHLTPDQGADVIACSLGPNGADWDMESILEDAINFCVTSGRSGLGTPVFWAVSNGNYTIDGVDGTDEVSAFDKTIAVGRSDKNDLENGSAFGPELDFLAPGVSVFSCRSGGGYGASTGTSFAAPLAAGVATLLIAISPDLRWDDVRQVLRDTCEKAGNVQYDHNGHHQKYGYGRINAFKALSAL